MNFDDSFPRRVAIARTALGMTQDELAQKVGVVRRQIAAYEGGEAKPRLKALQNLAAALGASSEWLANGSGHAPEIGNVRKTITLREIPVINHMQVNLEPNSSFLDDANIIDFIPAPLDAGENAFAVMIEGDSMDSQKGLSFPDGTIVTFDPDVAAGNGDFVLCGIYEEKLLTFRQYFKDQGIFFLKSLNPEYPAIHYESFQILGVAVHAQITLNQSGKAKLKQSKNTLSSDVYVPEPSAKTHEFERRVSGIESKVDEILYLLRNKKPT